MTRARKIYCPCCSCVEPHIDGGGGGSSNSHYITVVVVAVVLAVVVAVVSVVVAVKLVRNTRRDFVDRQRFIDRLDRRNPQPNNVTITNDLSPPNELAPEYVFFMLVEFSFLSLPFFHLFLLHSLWHVSAAHNLAFLPITLKIGGNIGTLKTNMTL